MRGGMCWESLLQLLFCPFELLLNSRAVVFHNGGGAYSSSFLLSRSLELTFWFYVKEHLNRHELQRFYSLRQISSELGRGRAWLRCALNEHSLERYLHTLLADRPRLGLVTSPLVSYAPHTFSQLGGIFFFLFRLFIDLLCFLDLTMKTGLLCLMKRELVCFPPWLQVSLCFGIKLFVVNTLNSLLTQQESIGFKL